jgi:hypothetical protein
MKKAFLPLLSLILLVGCGASTTPVVNQITPATLTAPTFYENENTQQFVLTGERFEPGAAVLIGETREQTESVTPTSVTFYVPPTLLNAEFPQNPPSQVVIPVRVVNPNGQVSNTVEITVVPHCNPCGT